MGDCRRYVSQTCNSEVFTLGGKYSIRMQIQADRRKVFPKHFSPETLCCRYVVKIINVAFKITLLTKYLLLLPSADSMLYQHIKLNGA